MVRGSRRPRGVELTSTIPSFPGSAADVDRALVRAAGNPTPFTEISRAIRRDAGKPDGFESERWSDLRAYRGLLDLQSRGLARKDPGGGWILCNPTSQEGGSSSANLSPGRPN